VILHPCDAGATGACCHPSVLVPVTAFSRVQPAGNE
jgi:hypothetical protein